jgi:hypothetical protein
MLEQLEAIRERFLEVEQQIAMPEVVSDLKKFKTLSKEYKDLQKIVDQYSTYLNLLNSLINFKVSAFFFWATTSGKIFCFFYYVYVPTIFIKFN